MVSAIGTHSASGILPSRRRIPGRRGSVIIAVVAALIAAATVTVLVAPAAQAATPVGAGSYTTSPVGPLPSGCGSISTNPRQFLTDNAPAGAVPTNDWWSSLVFKKLNCQYSEILQAHPAAYLPNAGGLGFSYSTAPEFVVPAPGLQEYHYPYNQDFTAGVAGLNAPIVKVDDWSDWTVTPSWVDGSRSMTATIGHGLPMTYFKVTGGGAQLSLNAKPTVWQNNGATVGFTVNGHDYVAYAPTGAGWAVSGSSIASSLAGKDYYTVAVLPTSAASSDSDRLALAAQFGKYAHATVTGTSMKYEYDQASSTVVTTYGFTTSPAEGTEKRTVTALYQHQWKSLTGATPIAAQYVSPRGPMKVLVGVSDFSTSMAFHGVLPEVPAVADSSGADGALLDGYLAEVADDPMAMQKADTYWAGKGLGRAARIAEIADQVGDTGVRDSAIGDIRVDAERLVHRIARQVRAAVLLRQELGHADRLPGLLRIRSGTQRSPFPLRLLHRRRGHPRPIRPGLGDHREIRRHGRSADPGREQLRPCRHQISLSAGFRHLRGPRLGVRARCVRGRQ